MKQFDFVKHNKLFASISIGIIVVGILCALIFGVEMDISFTGGTLLKYSFTGEVNADKVKELGNATLGYPVDEVQIADNVVTVTLSDRITLEAQDAMTEAMETTYKDQDILLVNANSLDPTMGKWFFIKCLVAVALASILLMVYVAFRFRKIGGWSAGVMALLALLNDLLVAFFAFVIFRIPLDDNFVAVLLSILGYSLNGTIVIYDRIRENRRMLDAKTPVADVVNLSVNQSFTRCFNTALCTFAAIAVVAVMALALHMDSIVSFAVPMMFGIISGFYTSTCLCSPVWVLWVEHAQKRAKLKKELAKSSKTTGKKK